MKKILMLFMICLCACIAIPLSAQAATSPICKVQLSIGSVTSLDIAIDGNYYVKESEKTAIDRRTYTVKIVNDYLSLYEKSTGKCVISGKSSLSFVLCKATSGKNNYASVYNTYWDSNVKYSGNMVFYISSKDTLTLVNQIYLEDYLPGVLYGEVGEGFNLEAIKAQAVIARNFARNKISTSSVYDLGDTDNDQVYKGLVTTSQAPKCHQAVSETKDQYLYYYDEDKGKNVMATDLFYSSSNAGYIDIPNHYWSANRKLKPYDVIKKDPYDAKVSPTRETLLFPTTVSGSNFNANAAKLVKKLVLSKAKAEAGSDVTSVNDITITGFSGLTGKTVPERHTRGGCTCPFFTDGTLKVKVKIPINGKQTAKTYSVTLTFADLLKGGSYPVFTQRSSTYEFYAIEKTDDGYNLVHGRGGHGIGLSQYGAKQMAAEGKKCAAILDFYFPNTELTTSATTRPSLPTMPAGNAGGQDTNNATVTGTTVNVRSTPSTSGKVLGQVTKGARVCVLELDVNGTGWHKIEYGSGVGYMSGDYLDLDANANIPQAIQSLVITNASASAMSTASTSSTKLATIPKGTAVLVTKLNYQSGWHQIYYNNKTMYLQTSKVGGTPTATTKGYITANTKGYTQFSESASYVSLSKNLSVGIIDSTSVDGWVAVWTGGAVRCVRDFRVEEGSPAVAPTTFAGMVVTKSNANARTSASTSSTSAAVIPANTPVLVRKFNYASGWHQIYYNGQTLYLATSTIGGTPKTTKGYITANTKGYAQFSESSAYVSLAKNTSVGIVSANPMEGWVAVWYKNQIRCVRDFRIAAGSPPSTPSTPTTFAGMVVTKSNANARTSASTSSTSAAVIPANTPVLVRKFNYASGWHQIYYNGQTLYLATSTIGGTPKTTKGYITANTKGYAQFSESSAYVSLAKNTSVGIVSANPMEGWVAVWYKNQIRCIRDFRIAIQ